MTAPGNASTFSTVQLSASDPTQASTWDDLVSRSSFPDTYYRPGYVRAYEVEGHGQAMAVHVEAGDAGFLFPLLLRPISGPAFAPNPGDQDAMTPYGYGGILPLAPSTPSAEQAVAALQGLAAWSKSRQIVSCFIRLHPLLEQEQWLKRVAERFPELSLHRFGPTTSIPLATWSEDVMRKGRRSDLAVARRALRVTFSALARSDPNAPPLDDALTIFRAVYEGTMARLQAASFYRFSSQYYAALAAGLGDALAVGLAWHGDRAVGGALFLAGPDSAHYHLSGTDEDGRRLKATTLLIRQGIEWARSRGCSRLHLGGGATGDDSLFQFKKGFGGDLHHYSFAGLVADRARYHELLAARLRTGQPLRPNFFPAYRA